MSYNKQIDFLQRLTADTKKGMTVWEETVDFVEFRVLYEDCFVSVAKVDAIRVELVKYDREGSVDFRISSGTNEEEIAVSRLFDIIMDQKMHDTKTRSISFFKFSSRLLGGEKRMPDYHFADNDVIKIAQQKGPFIEPLFSQQPTSLGYTNLDKCQVILISAPGATGKSALCNYVSSSKSIPIINLNKPIAMGAHSVTGLLSDNLDFDSYYSFQKGIYEGKNCLIIDAVDEGYARTGQIAFEGFLDDIVKISKKSVGLSFVILGRTSTLEYTALYLEEKDVKVTMLQIEPFTIEKAQLFINAYMKSDLSERFAEDYQQVRDYIIQEIGGFFKDETELKRKMYERFIGYAPVLLSIATLLNRNNNYNSLLTELRQGIKKHIDLVVDIIEMLLDRDRNKIDDQLLPMLSSYPKEFQEKVIKDAYSIQEQCERILSAMIGKPYYIAISGDNQFDQKYNEACQKWFEDHPFMESKSQVQNKVFESYVLAYLTMRGVYVNEVSDYLNAYKRNSYLFFDLCNKLYGEHRDVDYKLIPALMDSFKMMDRPNKKGIISIDGEEASDGSAKCFISFAHEDEEDVEFIFQLGNTQSLELPSIVSYFFVDAPIRILVPNKSFEVGAPTSISCSRLEITSQSMLITSSGVSGIVCFSAPEFVVSYRDGMPLVSSPGNVECKILTNSELSYPYVQYRDKAIVEIGNDDLNDRFQKLRRILLQFRSHGKGNLARYKDKIDNLIGRTSAIGGKVLTAMKNSGMIYSEERLYFVNSDKVDEVLGLSYDDVFMCKINDKVKDFLSRI